MIGLDSSTYSTEIREVIKNALRLTGKFLEPQLNEQIDRMTKIAVMDTYLDWHGDRISSTEIFKVVKQVFKLDLDAISGLSNKKLGTFEVPSPTDMDTSIMPLSRVVIDLYLIHCDNKITGVEVRGMINHFFGVNLDGVASLEKARISLYSKGQWVVQNEKDLFVVHTGTGDIDVKVFSTEYFSAQTGLEELPNELQQSLTQIGFAYDVKSESYYFSNPTSQAVSDAFKGQTIGAIVEAVHKSYAHL